MNDIQSSIDWYVPSLTLEAQTRLSDMLDYAAQVTGLARTDFTVTDYRAVALPDVTAENGKVSLVYRAEIDGTDGVRYRVRLDDDASAGSVDGLRLCAVLAETDTEREIAVDGAISHAVARSMAASVPHAVFA